MRSITYICYICGVALIAAAMLVIGCTSDTSEQAPGGALEPNKAVTAEDETRKAERLAAGAAEAAAVVERARAGTITGNVLQNGSFESWSERDGAQLPVHWLPVEQETTVKVSRVAAAGDVHDGKNALRVVADPGVVSLGSDDVAISETENAELRGKMVTAGVWAKADTPGAAFVNIRDGVGESLVIDHPGDGSWQFIAVSHTLDPHATVAMVRIGNRKQDDKTAVVFDGAVLLAPAQ